MDIIKNKDGKSYKTCDESGFNQKLIKEKKKIFKKMGRMATGKRYQRDRNSHLLPKKIEGDEEKKNEKYVHN